MAADNIADNINSVPVHMTWKLAGPTSKQPDHVFTLIPTLQE
jgi:hypothetical protein